MITANDNRCRDFTGLYQMVDTLSKLSALAVTEPADSCRQTLETNFVTRKTNPAVEDLVLREQLEYHPVGDFDITRISGERDPPEWTSAFGEHGADVGGNKAWEVIGILHPPFICHRPDVVPVIKRDRTSLLHVEHGLDVDSDGLDRKSRILRRIALTKFRRVVQGQTAWNITVQRIVRACLIREHVRDPSAVNHLRENFGAVSNESDGKRPPLITGIGHEFPGFIQTAGHRVEIAGLDAAPDARRIHFHPKKRGARQGRCQWLGAAHAAQSRSEERRVGNECRSP